MNVSEIEEKVRDLIEDIASELFLFRLLDAYGVPKSSITRLQKGDYNLSKVADEILWKKKILFKRVKKGDLYSTIDQLKKSDGARKHDVRFVVVMDNKNLLAVDRKTSDTLDLELKKLHTRFDFFLPLAGYERSQNHTDSPADIRAAERMAKLYDELCKQNPAKTQKDLHDLNVFLARLLFCYFAEDTDIFEQKMFTNTVSFFTKEDGSDLQLHFDKLFALLNVEKRSDASGYLRSFPYVNGGLFAQKISSPTFSKKARNLILECGQLDWSAINPDIFGSMMQAVVHADQRGGMGMHYTSVSNIMKVIEPLFLKALYEEFEANKDNRKRLEALLNRLTKIKIFDPACGSGNFLIIAYKELRKFEMVLFKQIEKLSGQKSLLISEIKLSQFYGIELDDFAREAAVLSLWLAEHQMNLAFKQMFGHMQPSLPLRASGTIICGNAAKIDWEKVCPNEKDCETYILGNPPYIGFSMQSDEHKKDIQGVVGAATKLDYIGIWFLKGSAFLRSRKGGLAFVSTNSICQGEQVGLLWPRVLGEDLEIRFCHLSFKWKNNAKKNAAVICIIIGLAHKSELPKFIFGEGVIKKAKEISPYLSESGKTVINKRSKPISNVPEMVLGNMPKDGGNLFFSDAEKEEFVAEYPGAEKFIRQALGSYEFINGVKQWCLWIPDDRVAEAKKIKGIKKRLEGVEQMRLASKKKATREYAKVPHRFVEIRHQETSAVIVPRVSSERREYIPTGFLEPGVIVKDLAYAIYGAETWLFGVVSSRMHMVWMRAVTGRLKTDYRYSSALCYNNFPIPDISTKQKEPIRLHALMVLAERENHSEKTLAELYDPDHMPASLREAHLQLDAVVDRIYRSKPFLNDEERLAHLFTLFESMAPVALEEKNA